MKLKATDVEKLERFLAKIAAETYPEPITSLHTKITANMIERVRQRYGLGDRLRVLDVGCGQGVALERFAALGWEAVGITLNPTDVAACRERGFAVHQMDQSFLDFADNDFDFVWCRYCLEHSIFPYFTLSELFRVLKSGGYLYVEVPAPDTSCQHQANRNHYSVLGQSMWVQLITRSGFVVRDMFDIGFQVPAGPDVYWAMVGQKP
ncbi:MAG: class I SAM-dependent methyltransferase [Pseudanabaenaceae cyanobacterium]